MNYRPKYFILQELVPPEIFIERGEASWELLDGALLFTLDQLRDAFGPIVVNNWHEGGPFKESGFCSFSSVVHAKFSQHKFGCAVDIKPQKVTNREVYAGVLARPDKFSYVTVLEDILSTPTWVHIDVRNSSWSGVRIVKP